MMKQAETDGLTGLYNRTTIERRIKQELSRDEKCAFIIIDLDDLKTVNDTRGHAQGDRAIMSVADTLSAFFGKNALLGRIGGDELIAFLCPAPSEQQLRTTLEALVCKFSELRVGEDNTYPLHCSLGAVVSHAQESSFEALYQQADAALYHVKNHGKNNYALYSEKFEQFARR